MTSALISRRTALLGSMTTMAAGSLALAGCGGGGGGGGNGNSQLRAINLTNDLPSVDLFTDDTVGLGALATETLSSYKSVEAKEYTLRVKKAGDGRELFSGLYTLGKDTNFTAVIWGREGALRVNTLPENEKDEDIATNNTRVRMFNATTDSGAVDVFFTTESADLGATTPTQGSLAAGNLSGFRDLSAGTYRLRVTGAGDPTDIRLDISGVALAARKHYNFVMTAGAGGVLLNGALIQQQQAAVVTRNTKARVRLVAGVNTAGVVAVSVAGSTLVGGLRSPSVGPYQLVNAGTLAVQIRVAGSVIADQSLTFASGADYTLMAYGPLNNAVFRLIADDNRLPSLSTRAKIRLIHGASGIDPITLSADFLALATDIPVGDASAYATTASGTAVRINVTSAASTGTLVDEPVNVQGQAVYTVFLLGGNVTTAGEAKPTGVIRRER
jgi:hypothetical protein